MIQAYEAIGIGLIHNGGIPGNLAITLVRPQDSRPPTENSEEPNIIISFLFPTDKSARAREILETSNGPIITIFTTKHMNLAKNAQRQFSSFGNLIFNYQAKNIYLRVAEFAET